MSSQSGRVAIDDREVPPIAHRGPTSRAIVFGARLLLLASLPGLAGSCALLPGGSVQHRLDVMPKHVCPGDSVTVSWNWGHGGTLFVLSPYISPDPYGSARPSQGGVAVGRRGTRRLAVSNGTRVLLFDSTNPLDPHGDIQVDLLGGEPVLLGAEAATTSGGKANAVIHVDAAGYSPRAAVQSVSNPMDCSLTVLRGGRSVAIPPHGSTTGFQGMPLVGDWHLRVDTGADPTPSNLMLVFSLNCP